MTLFEFITQVISLQSYMVIDIATECMILQTEITLFQVGKQFDALLVDTSAPMFDTFPRDNTSVSNSYIITLNQ